MTAFKLADAAIKTRTVVVVWRDDKGDLEQAKIAVSGDVGAYLDDAWANTVEEIAKRQTEVFSPDLVVRGGDGVVVKVNDDLRPDADAIALVLDPADRKKIKPSELPAESLYLYAVISTTKAGRIAMIKKGNPSKRAYDKKWVMRGDELRSLSEDPWQLHPLFDVAVSETGGWVLSYSAFEQLLRDSPRMLANVDTWVATASAALPMSQDNQILLGSRCRESSRMMRRLRAINARGHLSRVSIQRLQKHIKDEGLVVKEYVVNGQLVVTEDNVGPLLEILNEDLFRGGLTDDPFLSDGKRPRR